MKAYVSSTVNGATHEKNKSIVDFFAKIAGDVSLPVELESTLLDVPKAELPIAIAKKCKSLISEADFVILNTGHYGSDSSCEIGYAAALGKTVIGFVPDQSALNHLREDWIVKSMIDIIVVPDDKREPLYQLLQQDNSLRSKPLLGPRDRELVSTIKSFVSKLPKRADD
jgi:nucleoside 2-deoxyribosyltransferase